MRYIMASISKSFQKQMGTNIVKSMHRINGRHSVRPEGISVMNNEGLLGHDDVFVDDRRGNIA